MLAIRARSFRTDEENPHTVALYPDLGSAHAALGLIEQKLDARGLVVKATEEPRLYVYQGNRIWREFFIVDNTASLYDGASPF